MLVLYFSDMVLYNFPVYNHAWIAEYGHMLLEFYQRHGGCNKINET